MLNKIKNQKFTKGFTLIELMVSISIFSIVMVISMGAILSVLDDNHKSQSIRAVMDNLNYTLEGMTRNIRFGDSYHCGESVVPVPPPLDCPLGDNSITIRAPDNSYVTYKLNAGAGRIQKVVRGSPNDGTYDLTSSDVTITKLTFFVYGSYPFLSDRLQPKVIVVISGYSGLKETIRSSFTLETTLSQRKFDLQ